MVRWKFDETHLLSVSWARSRRYSCERKRSICSGRRMRTVSNFRISFLALDAICAGRFAWWAGGKAQEKAEKSAGAGLPMSQSEVCSAHKLRRRAIPGYECSESTSFVGRLGPFQWFRRQSQSVISCLPNFDDLSSHAMFDVLSVSC